MNKPLSTREKKEDAKKRKAADRKRKEAAKKKTAITFLESTITSLNASSDIMAVGDTLRKSALDLLTELFIEVGNFCDLVAELRKFAARIDCHLGKNYIFEPHDIKTKLKLYGLVIRHLAACQDFLLEFMSETATSSRIMKSVVFELKAVAEKMRRKEGSN